MVLFKRKLKTGEHELIQEGPEAVMHINYEAYTRIPSLEDDPMTMSIVVEKLAQEPASRIIFHQKKRYEYGFAQTQMLVEVAQVYNYFVKQKKILSQAALEVFGPVQDAPQRVRNVQYLILSLLKTDPIGAFVEAKRLLREEKISIAKVNTGEYKLLVQPYMSVLQELHDLLFKTRLIAYAHAYLDGYVVGSREVYRAIFSPVITPDFMYTRIAATPPMDALELDAYTIGKNAHVQIFDLKDTIKRLYHVIPPEFQVSEEKYELIDLARKVLAEHQPKAEEFSEPEKMRESFFNIGRDLLTELAAHKGLDISYSEIEEMAQILVRYTIGFGLIETLLQDDEIQDIAINSPAGTTPMFVVHGKYDECVTNIIPSVEDVESWASKLRLLSARPLDEANPILDTELTLPGVRARVAAISKPLNPNGIAFSIRRHRENPWTLPLFIKYGMLNDLAAGLLSFLIDGSRSIIVAGTRGSGKCVTGDTYIQLSTGSILPIKELIGEHKKDIDDGKIYNPKFEMVPSLTGLKISDCKLTDVWVRQSPKELIGIKTRSGKEIITTAEHPYFMYNEGIKNIRADQLKKGDVIASAREITINAGKGLLNLEKNEYFKFEENDEWYYVTGITNAQKFRIQKELTPEFAELLGLIIGDGHLDLEKLEFHNLCPELRETVKTNVGKLNLRYREFKTRTSIVVQVTSRNFSRILNKYFEIPFGKKADKVVIPQLVLKSNNKILAAFLRGYFDTDGYTPKEKRDLEILTASKTMGTHLQMVLLRFGIVAFLKKKITDNIPYYRVLIRGEFVKTFNNVIGFNHPSKKERLDHIIARNILENTNVDFTPDGNKILRKLRHKLRVTPVQLRSTGKDYWAYEKDHYRVSRKWFGKLIGFYKQRHKELKGLQLQVDILRNFAYVDYENLLNKLEKVRILLALSYGALTSDTKLSETSVRKTLQDYKGGNLEKVNAFLSLCNTYKVRLDELSHVVGVNAEVENLPVFANAKVTSYAQVSRNTGIKETTLKCYAYYGVKPTAEKAQMIQYELHMIKNDLVKRLPEASRLLNELGSFTELVDGIQIGTILSNLRNRLNIKNEELANANVCLMTVSNFFNGIHDCKFHVVRQIAQRTIAIFDDCINCETDALMKEAEALATSDIFWDEISSVETIGKTDEYVYDLTVEGTHNFVANGLIAHNTSLLGSVLVEIMRKYRVISLEDSVTGDAEILIRKAGKIEKTTIGNVIDTAIDKYGYWYNLSDHEVLGNDEQIEILSKNKEHKLIWTKPSKLIRHKVDKQIYEVKTRTGRTIKVTEDHSLFSLGADGSFKEIKPKELGIGAHIATIRKLPLQEKAQRSINILDHVEKINGGFLCGGELKSFIQEYYIEIRQLAKEHGYTRSIPPRWLRKGILPIVILKDLDALGIKLKEKKELSFKFSGHAETIPVELTLEKEFLTLIGIWLADGCYDKHSIIFSSFDKEDSELVRKVAERFKLNVKVHSDGGSLMYNSTTLRFVFREILGLKGDAYTKRVPNWVFNLSKEQIAAVLKGIFTGDGCVADKEIVIPLCSMQLLRDIQTLLLGFEINLRIGKQRKDKTYNAGISTINNWIKFRDEIGILQAYKKHRLDILCKKVSTHDSTDVIPLPLELKEKIANLVKDRRIFSYDDYVRRENNIGRRKFGSILAQIQIEKGVSENLSKLANADIFWDEISAINALEKQDIYVYDLSVPECENFVCNNILAHNTLELPVDALRQLGYNIQSMKVRSALAKSGTELAADEGIRSALRMGDSALIVGEVRSLEAKALYEAMRTGALANTVAGTIHGDSPYGVFDRVVNDLQVPKTSFKATDIIVVANPIRSADGLHRYRRIVSITEVRKEWENDPLAEHGFVDLMKYDSKTDSLVPTDALMNGDSVILKAIGGQIKEWAGSWDAIWENIVLRAKIKRAMLDAAVLYDIPDLLEAKSVVSMNDEFHRVSDKVRNEMGFLDSQQIFFEWEQALKRHIKVQYKK